MMRHATQLALLLLGGAAACTKIPERRAPSALGREALPDSISIPASWGNLVTVTVNPAFSDVEQLWFQDSTRQIRFVIFDVPSGRLVGTARVIARH